MGDITIEEMNKAGKKEGLQIWRIENMALAPITDKLKYGKFFVGDSYIVLRTKDNRGHMSWDLHFWLGSKSSQDEKGAAAILSTNMDTALGGAPVQFRELQGHESTTFAGYFKDGITYMLGGHASGFKKVRTNVNEDKRLFHLKGRRIVRLKEVERSWASFNQGDIFILQVENNIFQWNGSMCNRYEKLKAISVSNLIKNEELRGKGILNIVEEAEPIPQLMIQNLAGNPADIQPEQSDCDEKVTPKKTASLHHVSSDSGNLEVKNIGNAPFSQSALLSGDCFIVDDGSSGSIFVWRGKTASKDERSGAMSNALKFVKDNGYSANTHIQVVNEHSESTHFIQYFKQWIKKDQTIGFGKAYIENKIAKLDKTKFDVTTLYGSPKLASEYGMVDDGSGKVKIWRIEGNKHVALDQNAYGRFYSGDSYLVLYTYHVGNREESIIYMWQGLNSTKEEIAGCAILAATLDEEFGKSNAVHVRIVEGKESTHFLSIFDKPIIITRGGYNKEAGKEIGITDDALYQVRSSSIGGTKSIQVDTQAAALNSNDSFVLKTKLSCFIWVGIGASEVEIATAKYTAGIISNATPSIVQEGKESGEFWKILGGKKPYANDPRLQQSVNDRPARLFAVSNAKGKVMIEEVPGCFIQSDLEVDDIMMLDTWNHVFLWIGKGANAEERSEAPKLVLEYMKNDPRGRDVDTPLVTIKMGHEPPTFTGAFPSWDRSFFERSSDYETRLKNLTC